MKTQKKAVVGTKTETTKAVEVKKPPVVEASAPVPSPFVRVMGRGGSPTKAWSLETFNEFCVPAKYAGPCVMAEFDGDTVKAVPVSITETANENRPKVRQEAKPKPFGVKRSLLFKTEAEFTAALEAATFLATNSMKAKDFNLSQEPGQPFDFGEGTMWGHTGRLVAVWSVDTIGFIEGPQLGQLDKTVLEIRDRATIKALGLQPTIIGTEKLYFNEHKGVLDGKPTVQVYFGFVAAQTQEWTTPGAFLNEELFDPRVVTDEFFYQVFEQLVSKPARKEFLAAKGRTRSAEESAEAAGMVVNDEGAIVEKKESAKPTKKTNPTKGSALTKGGPTPLWTGEQILDWLGRQDKVKAAAELKKGVNPMTVLNEYRIDDPTHRSAILTVFGKKAGTESIQEAANALKNAPVAVSTNNAKKPSPKPAKKN